MTTTIQISNETADILKSLRKQTNSRSYDEVIQTILKDHQSCHSLFGFAGKKLTKKEILNGIRDKDDKY